MQGAGAMAAARARDRGRRLLDRRDRRAARRPRHRQRAARLPHASCAPTATTTSSSRSRRPTPSTSAPRSRSRCPAAGPSRIAAQCKGAGHDPAVVRDDAVLRRDRRRAAGRDRRPAARRARPALVRPHQRRRPALDQRHRDPHGRRRQRAWRSSPRAEDELRFGEALDALLRRMALAIVRDGEGAKRVGRVVVRGGNGPQRRARGARGGQLAAGQDRAARRRPELGPDRAGGRDGGRRRRAAGRRRRRSRACRSASPAWPSSTTAPTSRQRVSGDEVEYTIGLPGDGFETEVFFSDFGHGYITINAEYTT